jgi:hypothetical protein
MKDKKMKRFFRIELTDTFGGEANYSWVTRHKVKASTIQGAITKLAKDSGLSFRKVYDFGDSVRYNSKSGAICAFVEYWDEKFHALERHSLTLAK